MVLSSAEKQRIARMRRIAKWNELPKIPCACGCGTMIAPINSSGKPAKYAKGHNGQWGKKKPPEYRPWNKLGDKPLSSPERQRRYRERKYEAIDQLPKIPCACGCGTMIAPLTKLGKPARYAHGHNPGGEQTQFTPGQAPWNKGKPYPRARDMKLGKKIPAEEIARRTATRIEKYGVYQVKRGWKHTPETVTKMSAAARARDMTGSNNPFYGKTHTPETRQKLSEKLSGPNHPLWRGGTGKLPYGPEFTRKLKRQILVRDKYTCQRCGITQADLGRKLHVHHIDHDKQNNDVSNLVAVCPKCNIWYSNHRDQPFQRA